MSSEFPDMGVEVLQFKQCCTVYVTILLYELYSCNFLGAAGKEIWLKSYAYAIIGLLLIVHYSYNLLYSRTSNIGD